MSTGRALRADARRNIETVIEAARTLFAEQGVDVPMEQIGRAAGIGKGTLYRHFPTKEHLVAAVSRDRFDRLAASAGARMHGSDRPRDALVAWLREYDRDAQRIRGLRAVISDGIADEGSALFTDCQPMKEQAGALLRRSQQAGEVRDDVEITELLSAIAALPESFRDADGASRLLDLILRGLAPEAGVS